MSIDNQYESAFDPRLYLRAYYAGDHVTENEHVGLSVLVQTL